MLARQKCILFLRKILKFIPPIIPALLFVLFMGYFNILLYDTYHYTQFDLGVTYRTLYNFHVSYHFYNFPNPPFEEPQTFSKLIYVPLSFTLYIYNSPLTLLFDQIIFIAIGGCAIFFLSKQITNNSFISILIEILYFLYPATYGFMTQGGNLMVFFEPLLLISYLFYIKKKKIATVILIVLASSTNFLAPLIIIIFLTLPYLTKFLIFVKGFIKSQGKSFNKFDFTITYETVWNLLLFIIPLLFLFIGIRLYGISQLFSASRLGSFSTAVNSPSVNILQSIFENFSLKLSFLNMVFESLLYLPLLSIYSLPILIYLLFSWYSNQTIYYDILTRQYPYLFAAFLFISLAHVFRDLNQKKGVMKKIAVIIIISSIISFGIYSPFSVEKFQSGVINNDITVTPLEKNLSTAFNLIPMNASVLVQNQIVQLDNRANIYFPGYYNNESVQYAVFVPYMPGIFPDAYSGFCQPLANDFANNASYGIYVRLGNIEIYKLNFVGPPVMFSKEKFFGTGDFYTLSSHSNINDSFETGYVSLSPGCYNLTVREKLSSNLTLPSKNITGQIAIMGSYGNELNYTSTFYESSFAANFVTISGKLFIKNFDSYYISIEFKSSELGNLSFIGSPNYTIIS